MNKYTAEILGTLILTLAVNISLAGAYPGATPLVAGLALGMCVYTLGPVSGAHFNPAITLGLLAIRKITTKDAVMYVSSQLIGAAAGALIARHMVNQVELVAIDNIGIMMCELLGTIILALGVASCAVGKTSAGASGLTVGGSLALGILIAAAGSNGVLNPAVALGIGSFSFSYLLGPIAGAVLAMGVYKHLTT